MVFRCIVGWLFYHILGVPGLSSAYELKQKEIASLQRQPRKKPALINEVAQEVATSTLAELMAGVSRDAFHCCCFNCDKNIHNT